jgi:hypothetical protein
MMIDCLLRIFVFRRPGGSSEEHEPDPIPNRSLPGLPKTKQFLFTCHDQTKRRFPLGGGVFVWVAGLRLIAPVMQSLESRVTGGGCHQRIAVEASCFESEVSGVLLRQQC